MAAVEPGELPTRDRDGDSALRRELYFFTLYRVLVAALIVFVAFSPLALPFADVAFPVLARSVGIAYLILALVLLFSGRNARLGFRRQVVLGLAFDIAACLLAIHATRGIENGISLLLTVNIAAGALLLPPRWAMLIAVLAATLSLLEFYLTVADAPSSRNLGEVVMFAATYVAATALCVILGRQMRESHALAARRGAEVANLAQLNELIIRRMRTGVLVVNGDCQIQLVNEAGWHQLGQPSPSDNSLSQLAPDLARRFYEWRVDDVQRTDPIVLGRDTAPVLPRFARLSVSDDQFLIFLDDTALVSRRAEELTLSNLGRLSASIAHEIRNPLAAISYSAQLLEESPALPESDRRLVEIIVNHCSRMNGIVENVLSLSRRERSRPESVDLSAWVYRFVDDFKEGRYLEHDDVRAVAQARRLYAMVDPQQLHQVINNLVENALKYGRMPGEPARVTITARQLNEGSPPLVEVIDRGPGIPQRVADSIFEPFFTTHEHGTGLGLYLARQLCEANQATLEYVPLAGGGSCFRVSLQGAGSRDMTAESSRSGLRA